MIRFKRFARGEETRSVGMTHVRFDSAGKVVLHQDFDPPYPRAASLHGPRAVLGD